MDFASLGPRFFATHRNRLDGGRTGRAFRKALQYCHPLMGAELYAHLEIYFSLGYWPNLRQPRTFSEKLNCAKLGKMHPLWSLCADKWAVRDYAAKTLGSADILTKVYYVGSDLSLVNFHELPKGFVVKATHGSAWTMIIKDKSTVTVRQIIQQCEQWLSSTYSVSSRNFLETHYDNVEPRILIEELIEDSVHSTPLDYKFFCFHGTPVFVQVDIDRFGTHRRNFYDLDWHNLDLEFVYKKGPSLPRPPLLSEMIRIARALSADFDFCRVDLYNPDSERVRFGEITFTPEGGLGSFKPLHWDYMLGDLWGMQ